MPIITFNGPIGCGGNELGLKVADLLDVDYVDRIVFAEAAKRVGSTISALAEKEERVIRLRDRIAYFLQNMLEKSAVSGAAGEPYFSPGIEMLPGEQYSDLADEPITESQRLSDSQFLEATTSVIQELASSGNVVVIGRGANIILKDAPGTVHVALAASPAKCVDTIVERERFSRAEGEKFFADAERARQAFFRKFFKVHCDNQSLYHVCLNMDRISLDTAAEIVVHMARDLEA